MLRLERMIAAEEQPLKAAAVERDIDLTLTSLKKGAHLLKYGRRGKPKFCPFRLSNDESTLIWFSGKEEKHLKLSHVSRIIPGQRTICKDKDEAEVWFTGLKSIISRGISGKWRVEPRSGFSSEATSPRVRTRASSPLSSTLHSGSCSQKDGYDGIHLQTSEGIPPKITLEKALSDVILHAMPPKGFFPSDPARGSMFSLSSGGSDGTIGYRCGMNVDAFRISLSSAFSTSSQGSGHDDGDPLGDIYIWGEGTCNGLLGGGVHKVGSHHGVELDSLVPKPLESAVRLDVQSIACGGRHGALVTKHGDVFTWGEELRGRLGHGVDSDVSHPKIVESLKNVNVEQVACGEYHSCAVSLSGELYVWGDTSYNIGQEGSHGREAVLWIPKKLGGHLDGVHVSSVSCGPWHTAVVTSAGKLFTFGDGTFGVLGHGDRKSVSTPREVKSLKGIRTFRASCGVWHTAAIVEVMTGSSISSNCSSVKLFTWGDGDKGQLGHVDRESKLVPTCVAALVEPSFCQVACGHSLTVALTTTGHVYTMGSPVCGQLGNPRADGKLPTRVEGKLVKNFVEEIACGSHHVAVLTSKSEVYTWGKGANGRLGHGDVEDRNSPTLVEALKDKRVKSIVCGTSFTAAICLHKWLSGIDQSLCSACRLPFNFKRKRHNCYNCGLAFCNSCSSKKTLKTSMAPVSTKPYRVCDNCYEKINNSTQTSFVSMSIANRRESIIPGSNAANKNDCFDSKIHLQFSRNPFIELFKEGESRCSRKNKKLGFRSRASSPPGGISRRNENPKSSYPVFGSSKKFFSVSLPGSRMASRASSPTSKRPSPPRSTTPLPALSCLTSNKVSVGGTAGTNDSIRDEIFKLRAQVDELTHKTELQEDEIGKTTRQLEEALSVAAGETAKCKAAKEVIKALTSQLKELAGIFPIGEPRNSVMLPTNDKLTKPESHCSGNQCSPFTTNFTSNDSGLETDPKARNRLIPEHNDGEEWVEQYEQGVYITLVALPGSARDLKRIRFSRKQFTEKQAEQWWTTNRARVYQRYNVSEGKEDSTRPN
ncbi:PREDICTED: uncharacterized protein LOC104819132 isoform X2 [Tarenaya hassleriana]|uniref:uncharacterized protein LOC104819132 isoform X2 n=1 Tax=Tarenaya hassleriana TaxID=28532 RepID=UPI00053C265C|nr:PREDICTED: uncharacterized protein LOC104819132 isoform X2 [Tarenaya hassleriana]